MDAISLASVAQAAHGVGTIACFRSLPMVGFVLTARTVRVAPKIALTTTFALASIVLRTWTIETAVTLGLAYAYFAGVATLMPAASRGVRDRHLTRGALFVACASAFLALPCLLFPDSVRAVALLLGWDFVLSSYSYCVEKARANEEASLAEGLFFVLVNPSLVYVRRGERIGCPAFRPRGAARALLGLLALLAANALFMPLSRAFEEKAVASFDPAGTLLDWTLFGFLRLILEYGRQSGLASVQIGLMRQIGYEIPERYRSPLLASDPLDFWRRWNTYVGGWALRYVFSPIAARYRGTGRTWRLSAAQGLGLAATFATIGVLHDAYAYAVALNTSWECSRAFVVMGVVVVMWAAVPRAYRAIAHRAARGNSRLGIRVLSRAGFWVIAVGWAAWGWQ